MFYLVQPHQAVVHEDAVSLDPRWPGSPGGGDAQSTPPVARTTRPSRPGAVYPPRRPPPISKPPVPRAAADVEQRRRTSRPRSGILTLRVKLQPKGPPLGSRP